MGGQSGEKAVLYVVRALFGVEVEVMDIIRVWSSA